MKQKISNKGYTLVEIMVSVVLFSLVFGMISGLFASALKAQRRSLTSQELLAQVSYTMEYLSRNSRMAQKQKDASMTDCLSKATSSYEVLDGGHTLKFVGNEVDPCCWRIHVEDGKLKRGLSLCTVVDPGSFLTSDDLVVEAFNVSLSDADTEQPRLTLFLRVRGAGEKGETQPVIEIQNTVSQRNLNVD